MHGHTNGNKWSVDFIYLTFYIYKAPLGLNIDYPLTKYLIKRCFSDVDKDVMSLKVIDSIFFLKTDVM